MDVQNKQVIGFVHACNFDVLLAIIDVFLTAIRLKGYVMQIVVLLLSYGLLDRGGLLRVAVQSDDAHWQLVYTLD